MINNTIMDIKNAVKIIQETPQKGNITDYKTQKQEAAKLLLKGAIQKLVQETTGDAKTIAQKITTAKLEEIDEYLQKIAQIASEQPETRRHQVPKLPYDIQDEINADLNETQACIKAQCYRSAVILCGRIMETALHRKYYDATGNDLLEKAPGTGLGTLIAKLAEKGIKLDPGLTNQIHLINQIRVYSVHTKKDTFTPSKTQTEAIYLYTLDILEKLFK